MNQVENCLHVTNDQGPHMTMITSRTKLITICPNEEKKALVNTQLSTMEVKNILRIGNMCSYPIIIVSPHIGAGSTNAVDLHGGFRSRRETVTEHIPWRHS